MVTIENETKNFSEVSLLVQSVSSWSAKHMSLDVDIVFGKRKAQRTAHEHAFRCCNLVTNVCSVQLNRIDDVQNVNWAFKHLTSFLIIPVRKCFYGNHYLLCFLSECNHWKISSTTSITTNICQIWCKYSFLWVSVENENLFRALLIIFRTW